MPPGCASDCENKIGPERFCPDNCCEILSLTMSAESRVLWTWFCLHSEERIILFC